MKLIYIIEDHKVIAEGVRQYLEAASYEVKTFYNLTSARIGIKEKTPDLILQDVMLPDGDGFSFIQEFRKNNDALVIFMTARITEEDRIRGFEIGADDYITKPFSPKELVLRVQALFRRVDQNSCIPCDREVIFFADDSSLVYNLHKHKILVNGEEIYFTAAEWRVLSYLIENSNHLVTRASILQQCFDYSYASYDRIVDTHIKNIRAKLGIHHPWIETVRGYGYRFIGYTAEEIQRAELSNT